jgi:hypothetical protein
MAKTEIEWKALHSPIRAAPKRASVSTRAITAAVDKVIAKRQMIERDGKTFIVFDTDDVKRGDNIGIKGLRSITLSQDKP